MTPFSCTFCGARHPVGMLFDSPGLMICRVCRDQVLTALKMLGVPLTEANPWIAEFCVDCHMVENAWWDYYDSVRQASGTVVKAVNPKDRGYLTRVVPAPPGKPYYVMSHYLFSKSG